MAYKVSGEKKAEWKEKAIENVFRYGKHYREKAVHNTHFVC